MRAFAGSRTLVVGIVLGEPTGVAAKWYLKDDQAVQAAVGSAFIGGGLQLHGDYVLHPYLLQSRESYVLPVYVGVRVRLIDDQNGREASSALRLLLVGGLLFDLAAAEFAAAAPGLTAGVEQGSRSAPADARIVLASVPTVGREASSRLLRLPPDQFYLLVGFTATPRRGDKQALSEVFEEIAYARSLPEMVREGYLRPVRGWTDARAGILDDHHGRPNKVTGRVTPRDSSCGVSQS